MQVAAGDGRGACAHMPAIPIKSSTQFHPKLTQRANRAQIQPVLLFIPRFAISHWGGGGLIGAPNKNVRHPRCAFWALGFGFLGVGIGSPVCLVVHGCGALWLWCCVPRTCRVSRRRGLVSSPNFTDLRPPSPSRTPSTGSPPSRCLYQTPAAMGGRAGAEHP
jgi:hypothetical protein